MNTLHDKYDWVEANIAFYKAVPHIFEKEEKSSLHIHEENLHWGGVCFTKLTAIGYEGESTYTLKRNGKTQQLTTEQGKKVFYDNSNMEQ